MPTCNNQDLEAAFAIARLSEKSGFVEMSMYKDTNSTSPPTGNYTSFPRATNHVRTAVMPYAQSRVERVQKRKIDQVHYSDAMSRQSDAVTRAIELEKDNVLHVRKYSRVSNNEIVDDFNAGRFIRTSRPTSNSTAFTPERTDCQIPRNYVLLPITSYQPSMVRQEHDRVLLGQQNSLSTNTADNIITSRDRYSTARNQGAPARIPRNVRRQVDLRNVDKSMVDTYYNLGQTAAASQFFLKPSNLLPAPKSSPAQQVLRMKTSTHTRRVGVDSHTMTKVKNGEFGRLSVIQRYINILGQSEKLFKNKNETSDNTNDVVLDLSTHRDRHEDPSETLYEERLGYGMSKSCSTSPWLTSLEVDKRLSSGYQAPYLFLSGSQSVPCSPYRELELEERRCFDQHLVNKPDDQTSENEYEIEVKVEVTDLIPDNRLPLKKRRLHVTETSSDCSDVAGTVQSSKHCIVKPEEQSTRRYIDDQSQQNLCEESIDKYDHYIDIRLHEAVAEADMPAVSYYVSLLSKLHLSVDYYNHYKQTALHVAVLTNQPTMVNRLLEVGASADVVDGNGCNSLHLAASSPNQSISCLQILLRHQLLLNRLDFDAVTYNGETVLHKALRCSNFAAVKCLIDFANKLEVLCNDVTTHHRDDDSLSSVPLRSRGKRYMTPSGAVTPSSNCATEITDNLKYAFMRPSYLPACCPTG